MHARSLKIIDHSESEKIIIEKKILKELKYGIFHAKTELHFP